MTTDIDAAATFVRKRWERYVRADWSEHAPWIWRMLSGLYGEPARHYHTFKHIEACLLEADRLLEEVPSLDRQRIELALIWHDAVYVPGRRENERMSASLLYSLRDALHHEVRPDVLEYACTAIIATQSHDTEWYGSDAMLAVLDIDMSILGQDATTYDAYVKGVRMEFGSVSDDAWRHGRGNFLERTLGQKKSTVST